jgi:hypothetical protein
LANNNLGSLTLSLPAVLQLDVTNNELKSLAGLVGMTALESLDCGVNRRLPQHFEYSLAVMLPSVKKVNGKSIAVTRTAATRIVTAVDADVKSNPKSNVVDCCDRVKATLGSKLSEEAVSFIEAEAKQRLRKRTKPRRESTSTSSKSTVGRVLAPGGKEAVVKGTATPVVKKQAKPLAAPSGRMVRAAASASKASASAAAPAIRAVAQTAKRASTSAGKQNQKTPTQRRSSRRSLGTPPTYDNPKSDSLDNDSSEFESDTGPSAETAQPVKKAVRPSTTTPTTTTATAASSTSSKRKSAVRRQTRESGASECGGDATQDREKRAASPDLFEDSEPQVPRHDGKRRRQAAPLVGQYELCNLVRAHGVQADGMADCTTEVSDLVVDDLQSM